MEDRLSKLGYKKSREVNLLHYPKEAWYTKPYGRAEEVNIVIYLEDGIIKEDFCYVEPNGEYTFHSQEGIDSLYNKLTEALKILKKDLEVFPDVKD